MNSPCTLAALRHLPWRLAALLFVACAAPLADAALVNWGDVSDPQGGVVFQQVTEENAGATTLFAAEATGPTAVGDTLSFVPQGFESQSSGGAAHLVDSTLRTTVAAANSAIQSITINEFGDYALGGLGGGEATASVGAAFFWRVLEVAGQPINLPLQIAQLVVTGGGDFARPGDDGSAIPWTGSVLLDIASFLDQQDVVGNATLVELTFDNTLQTAADESSNAFIKKKGVEIIVDGWPTEAPEPAGAALLAAAAAATAAMRFRLG